MKSENQAEMASGTELHERHGQNVMLIGCMRVCGYALLLASLVLLTILITQSLV